jgi:2-keto-3-deoxy-L-rhamnonate aldolase RhmA
MMPYENKLRKLLTAEKPTIGTHIGLANPFVTELVGLSGFFDYIEFAGEYQSYTDYDLANIARTAEMYDLSTMIKIDQSPRVAIAERALGVAGIQNMLFADLRTVEDVQQCVAAIHCDPDGIGGARFGRIMNKLSNLQEWVQYCNDVVIAIMIEKKPAVDNLEELLSVDGIDMVQWGPADFSVSSGIPGQWTNPKMREAELKVIKTALKMDIRPRIEYLATGLKHQGRKFAILSHNYKQITNRVSFITLFFFRSSRKQCHISTTSGKSRYSLKAFI